MQTTVGRIAAKLNQECSLVAEWRGARRRRPVFPCKNLGKVPLFGGDQTRDGLPLLLVIAVGELRLEALYILACDEFLHVSHSSSTRPSPLMIT